MALLGLEIAAGAATLRNDGGGNRFVSPSGLPRNDVVDVPSQ